MSSANSTLAELGRHGRWVEGALITATSLSALIILIPRLSALPMTDEGVYLVVAERIVQGQAIYQDFFQFLCPGYFFFLAAQMKFLGAGLVAMRLSMVILLFVHAVILYLIVRRVAGSRLLAAGLASVFLVAQTEHAYVLSHHFLSLTLADLTFLLLLRFREGRRWASWGAAASCSLCILSTQTHGGLTWIAAMAFLYATGANSRGRELLGFAWKTAVLPGAVVLLLLGYGALPAAYESTVKWTLTNYRAFDASTPYFAGGLAPFANILDGHWSFRTMAGLGTALFIGYGQILSITLLALLIWRRARLIEAQRTQCIGLALFSTAGWLSCFSFPNPFLISISSALGYATGAALLIMLALQLRAGSQKLVGSLVLAAVTIVVGLKTIEIASHSLKENGRAIRQSVVWRGEELWSDPRARNGQPELIEFLGRNLPAGSDLFVLNWASWVTYFGGYRNPTRFDGIWPVYNSSEQVAEAIRDLDRSQPRFIVRDDLLERLVARGDPRFARIPGVVIENWPLFRYVDDHYVLVKTFGAYKVFERK